VNAPLLSEGSLRQRPTESPERTGIFSVQVYQKDPRVEKINISNERRKRYRLLREQKGGKVRGAA